MKLPDCATPLLGSGVGVLGELQRLRRGAWGLLGPGAVQRRRGCGERHASPCNSQSGGALAVVALLGGRFRLAAEQGPSDAGNMGQCGITSSKTVLVFLNLIFWVSGAGGRRRVRGGQ